MGQLCAIIVTYNSQDFIDEFLDSVISQVSIDWKLVVVDNGSQDETLSLVDRRADPRIVVIRNNNNVGVASATNQGIGYSLQLGCEAVILLNNDASFHQSLFAELFASLRQLDADAVSALIVFYSDRKRIWYSDGYFGRFFGFISVHSRNNRPRFANEPYRVVYMPTTCAIFKSDVFIDIGPLDESYFCYAEDTDFIWRMGLKNKCLYVDPRVKFSHHVSGITGSRSIFSTYYNHRNAVYFARKFSSFPMQVYSTFVYLLLTVARTALKRQSLDQMRASFSGLRDGWRIILPDNGNYSGSFNYLSR